MNATKALLLAFLPTAAGILTYVLSVLPSNRSLKLNEILKQFASAKEQDRSQVLPGRPTAKNDTNSTSDSRENHDANTALANHSKRSAWMGANRLSYFVSIVAFFLFLYLGYHGFFEGFDQGPFKPESNRISALILFGVTTLLATVAAAGSIAKWDNPQKVRAHVPVLDQLARMSPSPVKEPDVPRFESVVDVSARPQAIGFFVYYFGLAALGAGLFRLVSCNGTKNGIDQALEVARNNANYTIYVIALMLVISLLRTATRDAYAATMLKSPVCLETLSQTIWVHTAIGFTISLGVVYFVTLGVISVVALWNGKGLPPVQPIEIFLNIVAITAPVLSKPLAEIGKKLGG